VAGDNVLLQLYPRDKASSIGSATTTHQLQAGFQIQVTGKPVSTPAASSLLFDQTVFVASQDENENWLYSGVLNLGRPEMFAALGSSQTLAVMLVIQITDTSGAIQTFLAPITIFAPYYTGSEGSPPAATPGYLTTVQSLAAFIQNLIAITGQTGGGATNIDGISTTTGSTPAVAGWKIEINDADSSRWRLDVGTGSDVNVANQKVVPVDYNAGAPLVWTRYA